MSKMTREGALKIVKSEILWREKELGNRRLEKSPDIVVVSVLESDLCFWRYMENLINQPAASVPPAGEERSK